MGSVIWRELATITRTPAYWLSAAVYVVALAAFVTVWGDGIPVVGARSSWEQFVSVETAFLAVLLPWIAARFGCSSRRELVLTGFITARSSEQCLLAKSIALMVALMGVELSGLPVITLMRQIAAAHPFAVVSTATSLAVLAMYVAVVTTAISFMLANPLRVWVASTALTLAATAGRLPAAALFVLTGTVIAAALYLSSMRARVLYLPESDT